MDPIIGGSLISAAGGLFSTLFAPSNNNDIMQILDDSAKQQQKEINTIFWVLGIVLIIALPIYFITKD